MKILIFWSEEAALSPMMCANPGMRWACQGAGPWREVCRRRRRAAISLGADPASFSLTNGSRQKDPYGGPADSAHAR